MRPFCARSWPGLVGGQFPATVERQRQIFDKHLAPWIGRFFADLEAAQAAGFYRHVGAHRSAVHRDRERGIRAVRASGDRQGREDAAMKAEDKTKVGRRQFFQGARAWVPAAVAVAPLATEARGRRPRATTRSARPATGEPTRSRPTTASTGIRAEGGGRADQENRTSSAPRNPRALSPAKQIATSTAAPSCAAPASSPAVSRPWARCRSPRCAAPKPARRRPPAPRSRRARASAPIARSAAP